MGRVTRDHSNLSGNAGDLGPRYDHRTGAERSDLGLLPWMPASIGAIAINLQSGNMTG